MDLSALRRGTRGCSERAPDDFGLLARLETFSLLQVLFRLNAIRRSNALLLFDFPWSPATLSSFALSLSMMTGADADRAGLEGGRRRTRSDLLVFVPTEVVDVLVDATVVLGGVGVGLSVWTLEVDRLGAADLLL